MLYNQIERASFSSFIVVQINVKLLNFKFISDHPQYEVWAYPLVASWDSEPPKKNSITLAMIQLNHSAFTVDN